MKIETIIDLEGMTFMNLDESHLSLHDRVKRTEAKRPIAELLPCAILVQTSDSSNEFHVQALQASMNHLVVILDVHLDENVFAETDRRLHNTPHIFLDQSKVVYLIIVNRS